MRGLPAPLAALVDQFSTLPGIGAKSALRLVLNLIGRPPEVSHELAQSLSQLHNQVGFCPTCGCFSERNHCTICHDPRRDQALLCVVEQAVDVLMIERGGFRGGYHVLHGRLNPMDGVGPEQLTIEALQQRVNGGEIREIVLSTSATIDGEATAFYIANLFSDYEITISRIARGVPEGGELEYLDEFTLSKALEQRVLW
ncbi:MAG: recombination mediator RecR [Mariprofundales bacterium]